MDSPESHLSLDERVVQAVRLRQKSGMRTQHGDLLNLVGVGTEHSYETRSRQLDHCLQRLRKRGTLAYSREDGWRLVEL